MFWVHKRFQRQAKLAAERREKELLEQQEQARRRHEQEEQRKRLTDAETELQRLRLVRVAV